jgi:ribosomal protein S15P/S13E
MRRHWRRNSLDCEPLSGLKSAVSRWMSLLRYSIRVDQLETQATAPASNASVTQSRVIHDL